MTTTPPQKLWILLKSHDAVVVNHPTQVFTKDCDNIDDFIDAIKKKLHNKLGHVDPDNITLHLTEDSPALRTGLALNSVVTQPGFIKDDESPLVVKAQLPISRNEGSTSF